ncbi:hypothetical protein [Cetobacterium somerae]|nr:hypothetical protein [Cetobacterium somerae]
MCFLVNESFIKRMVEKYGEKVTVKDLIDKGEIRDGQTRIG